MQFKRALYIIQFKEVHPECKIGFSKFCTLRPKWCVSVGASGTHSVCDLKMEERSPGTRSYHHYVPLSTSNIVYKLTSEDIGYHNTF